MFGVGNNYCPFSFFDCDKDDFFIFAKLFSSSRHSIVTKMIFLLLAKNILVELLNFLFFADFTRRVNTMNPPI